MRVDHSKTIDREVVLQSLVPLLTACHAETNLERIASKERSAHIVFARAIVASALNKNGFTSTQIGYVVNRDHSAVLYLLGHRDILNGSGYVKRAIEEFQLPSEAKNKAMINFHQGMIQHHKKQLVKLLK